MLVILIERAEQYRSVFLRICRTTFDFGEYHDASDLDFDGSYLFIGDESNTINAIDVGNKILVHGSRDLIL